VISNLKKSGVNSIASSRRDNIQKRSECFDIPEIPLAQNSPLRSNKSQACYQSIRSNSARKLDGQKIGVKNK